MFVNESVSDPVETVVTLPAVQAFETGLMLDLLNDDAYAKPIKDGRMALTLAPYQSVLAVFDRDTADRPCAAAEKPLVPAGGTPLRFRIETAPYTDRERYTLFAEHADASCLQNMTDLHTAPDFSGKIRYSCSFEAPDGVCGIDLGAVGQTARLWLNGVYLGMRVCNPYRYDLSSALHSGKNELVIEVANTLANALHDPLSCYMTIPASGLIGPVQWLKKAE